MIEVLHYLAVLGVALYIGRCAWLMTPETPRIVKCQHGAVLLLAVVSLPVFGVGKADAALLALALCGYVWFNVLLRSKAHHA